MFTNRLPRCLRRSRLGFDGGGASDPYTRGGGYTALLRAGGFRDVLSSARALLWLRGALSRLRLAVLLAFAAGFLARTAGTWVVAMLAAQPGP